MISHPKGDFAAKGEFRRGFRSSFRNLEVISQPFRSPKVISQQKWDFAGGFAAHFATAKWAFTLRNGTRVLRSGFAAAKFFTEGLCGCEMVSQGDPFFIVKPQFRRRVLLAVKFLQDNEFLYFCASLILCGFLPPLLKFLLILIIQKNLSYIKIT